MTFDDALRIVSEPKPHARRLLAMTDAINRISAAEAVDFGYPPKRPTPQEADQMMSPDWGQERER